jgi:glycosyltransferase involved in cell wall biosynthesis
MKKNICHFTTRHRANDNRILELQAINAVRAGYNVQILGLCEHEAEAHHVKMQPIAVGNLRVFKQCMAQKCDLYEFHDPSLLWVGVLLRICGKTVIFDAHENYEEKVKSRIEQISSYLKPYKFVLARLWWFYEKACVSLLSGKIVADETVYKKYGGNTVLLPNVPGKEFYETPPRRTRTDDVFRLIYVGTLSWDRGIVETIAALQKTNHPNVEFHIIGDTKDSKLIEYIEHAPKTIWHGRVPWRELKHHLVNADAGIVLLQPIDAYLYCPGENIVKLWEYMSLSLPVLISDFPKLRALCERLQFGVCVKPDDPIKIAEAIDWMIDHPDECKSFGECGRQAVEEEYNAEKQVQHLIELYKRLLPK